MITISKPLSATQAETYNKSEFTSLEQSYYTQRDRVSGEWQGEARRSVGSHRRTYRGALRAAG